MKRSLAASWAVIGLATQWTLVWINKAVLSEGNPLTLLDVESALQAGLVHYVGWGLAGYLLGSALEPILDEAFRQQCVRNAKSRSESSVVVGQNAKAVG